MLGVLEGVGGGFGGGCDGDKLSICMNSSKNK